MYDGGIAKIETHSSMYDEGISIETYPAGAGRDVAFIVDNKQLKCTATLVTLPLYSYNPGKCRLADKFYEKKFKFWVSM